MSNLNREIYILVGKDVNFIADFSTTWYKV